jgi:hypothetical protein
VSNETNNRLMTVFRIIFNVNCNSVLGCAGRHDREPDMCETHKHEFNRCLGYVLV